MPVGDRQPFELLRDDVRSRWWTASDWTAKTYYPVAAGLIVSAWANWTTAAVTFGALLVAVLALSIVFAWLGYRAGKVRFRRQVWADRADQIRSRRRAGAE